MIYSNHWPSFASWQDFNSKRQGICKTS